MRSRRASLDLFRHQTQARADEWFYETVWRPQPLVAASVNDRADGCLVLDDGEGRGALLAQELRGRGRHVVRVVPLGDTTVGYAVAINPSKPEDYVAVLADAGSTAPVTDIVSFWPLRGPALAADLPSDSQRFGSEAAVLLIQAASGTPTPNAPRVWIATAGLSSRRRY